MNARPGWQDPITKLIDERIKVLIAETALQAKLGAGVPTYELSTFTDAAAATAWIQKRVNAAPVDLFKIELRRTGDAADLARHANG